MMPRESRLMSFPMAFTKHTPIFGWAWMKYISKLAWDFGRVRHVYQPSWSGRFSHDVYFEIGAPMVTPNAPCDCPCTATVQATARRASKTCEYRMSDPPFGLAILRPRLTRHCAAAFGTASR